MVVRQEIEGGSWDETRVCIATHTTHTHVTCSCEEPQKSDDSREAASEAERVMVIVTKFKELPPNITAPALVQWKMVCFSRPRASSLER